MTARERVVAESSRGHVCDVCDATDLTCQVVSVSSIPPTGERTVVESYDSVGTFHVVVILRGISRKVRGQGNAELGRQLPGVHVHGGVLDATSPV